MSLKKLKPDLVEPYVSQKIIHAINPPKPDYWEPTKITMKSIYQNYIRPNWLIFLIIFIICVLLIYRYRIVQDRRKESDDVDIDNDIAVDTNININDSIINEKKNKKTADDELEIYTKMIMDKYNYEKELSREPKIVRQQSNGFAYPMYPYHPGEFMPNSR